MPFPRRTKSERLPSGENAGSVAGARAVGDLLEPVPVRLHAEELLEADPSGCAENTTQGTSAAAAAETVSFSATARTAVATTATGTTLRRIVTARKK